MVEVKFQGVGGQGVVMASEILARTYFEEGWYPQCFSVFGGERRGAPVGAFLRISHEKIYLKCDIERPDHLILFDESFLDENATARHLMPGGIVLLNTGERHRSERCRPYTLAEIDALEISKRNGVATLVNTAMLGAYVRVTGGVSLDRLLKVIENTVPAAVEENLAAAKEAFEEVVVV
jgi:2-oxoacid:acceptor oxidoreductase gamma subunit (pyruvate/2-ketoisovalerate family)